MLGQSLKHNWSWCLGLQLSKSNYSAKLAQFAGFYLAFHVLAVAQLRLLSLKIVVFEGPEPRMILVLNRIVANTIEQLAIFGCLLFAA